MGRFSIAGRSTVAGTSARAVASLFAVANIRARLVECGFFNTTSTALAISLVRFTNATGVGAGLTEAEYDENSAAPSCTGFAGHTGDGGVGQVLKQAALGAAIGSGVIWTFGDGGIIIQPGTANGIGAICPTGTGQILDYYYVWDE